MSWIHLLPNKIMNRIISRSVESPLEIDGFVSITHQSFSDIIEPELFVRFLEQNRT